MQLLQVYSLPLEQNEFRQSAELGLGRALLFARQSPLSIDLTVIQHLLLHNTAYDPQIEGTRSWYATKLADAVWDEPTLTEWFIEEASRIEHSDEWDEHHRLRVAFQYATRGNRQMEQFLWARTLESIRQGFDVGVENLLELGGDLAIASLEAAFIEGEHDLYDLYCIVSYTLDEATLSEDVLGKLTQYQLSEAQRSANRGNPPAPATFESFKRALLPDAQKGKANVLGRRWGRTANSDELLEAARFLQSLLNGNEISERTLAYLYIFTGRAYPLDPAPLIEMAQQYDGRSPWDDEENRTKWRIVLQAYNALGQVQHPDVRAFALREISHSKHLRNTIDLFAVNYQDGDWALIQSALTRNEYDLEVFHGMGMGIRKVAKQHASREAIPSMLYMIENGPCSLCRLDFYERLNTINGLTDDLRKEAHFDAYADLREWAENGYRYPNDEV